MTRDEAKRVVQDVWPDAYIRSRDLDGKKEFAVVRHQWQTLDVVLIGSRHADSEDAAWIEAAEMIQEALARKNTVGQVRGQP